MRRHLLACFAALILALAYACGGASPATFALQSHPEGGTENGSSGGNSSGSGSSGGEDAASNIGPGPGGEAGGSDSSSGSASGADGASDAMLEGGDSASDAAPPGVLCPQGGQPMHCASANACCVTTSILGSTYTCGASPCSGVSIGCSSRADCSQGEVCCGTEVGAASYQSVGCAPTCTSGVLGPTRVVFCDPNVDTCPSGTTCRTSTILQAYTVCR